MTAQTASPILTVTWDTVIGARAIGEREHDTGYQEYEDVSLGDAVVDALARQLWHRIEAGAARIQRDALDRIREDVAKMRATAVAEEVTRIVREQLAGEVQQTDSWGKPLGPPKSLNDLIREDVQAYLDERVPRPGYSDRERPGGFRALLRHEVDEALTKDLRDTIRAARADVAAKVKDKAAEMIASAVQAVK